MFINYVRLVVNLFKYISSSFFHWSFFHRQCKLSNFLFSPSSPLWLDIIYDQLQTFSTSLLGIKYLLIKQTHHFLLANHLHEFSNELSKSELFLLAIQMTIEIFHPFPCAINLLHLEDSKLKTKFQDSLKILQHHSKITCCLTIGTNDNFRGFSGWSIFQNLEEIWQTRWHLSLINFRFKIKEIF